MIDDSAQNFTDEWYRVHAVVMLCATVFFVQLQTPLPLAIGAFLSFLLFFVGNIRFWQQLGSRSLIPNVVTGLRVTTLIVVTIFADSLSLFVIGGAALLVVISDGLDGYLARRYGVISYAGAYFDKETDAFFVLALSALIAYLELAGLWVLVLGILRYAYVVALFFFKPPKKKETRSFFGQTVAVLLMLALLLCFFGPTYIYMPILISVALLVFYSFGKSFVGMIRKV